MATPPSVTEYQSTAILMSRRVGFGSIVLSYDLCPMASCKASVGQTVQAGLVTPNGSKCITSNEQAGFACSIDLCGLYSVFMLDLLAYCPIREVVRVREDGGDRNRKGVLTSQLTALTDEYKKN